jgi:hypothetical protein
MRDITSVTVVFNIALPEKDAQEYLDAYLNGADNYFDHNCEIREFYIVETSEHG